MKVWQYLYGLLKDIVIYVKLALSDNGVPSSKRLISFIAFCVFIYIVLKASSGGAILPEYYVITLASLIGGIQLLTKNILKK